MQAKRANVGTPSVDAPGEGLQSELPASLGAAIRTPMNGILRTLELLLDTHLEDEQSEHAKAARDSARELLGVLNDILDFSCLRAGALQLEQIPFDVVRLLEEMVRFRAGEGAGPLPSIALELSAEGSGLPARVEGDPGQLRQILNGLVRNALRQSDDGSILIRARCTERATTTCRLRFEVQGSCEEPAVEPRERRAAGSPTVADNPVGEGTAELQLAIARQLCSLMGGSVEIDHCEGGAVTYFAEIPFGLVDDAPSALVEGDVRGVRVLVVVPQGRPNEQLCRAVEQTEARVEMAQGIDEMSTRLRVAREQWTPIDLVMALVEGPDAEARALIEAAHGETQDASIPCVALTPAGQRGDAPQFERLGYRGYLTTPVEPPLLPRFIAAVHRGRADEQARIETRHSAAELRTPSGNITAKGDAASVVGPGLLLVACPEESASLRTDLEKRGCRVLEASSEIEALEILTTEPLDLVLLGMQLSEGDGVATARAIRALPEPHLARIPIVGLGSEGKSTDRESCLEAGMDEHLAAPVDPEALDHALSKWGPRGA